MKLYLMNELPRIREEKKRFETALSNAMDLADNLVDILPIKKVTLTSDVHPADACDIIRSLTELLKAHHQTPEHDEVLAIALENTQLVLTRHVADMEVRSTPDDFMVLLPRNFNGYEFIPKLKMEYEEWLTRARKNEGASETLHDSSALQAYTTGMGIPIDAHTREPTKVEEEEDELTDLEREELGLSEEERAARQRKRTLTALFNAYLTTRTLADKPLLTGWVSALTEASAKPNIEEHTLAEMEAVSAALLPLDALVDMDDSPVAGLAKTSATAVPAASIAALSADAELFNKFATFAEQLQNFAVVLRDEVPRLVNMLPRNPVTARMKVSDSVNDAAIDMFAKAMAADDATHEVVRENAELQLAADSEATEREEGEGEKETPEERALEDLRERTEAQMRGSDEPGEQAEEGDDVLDEEELLGAEAQAGGVKAADDEEIDEDDLEEEEIDEAEAAENRRDAKEQEEEERREAEKEEDMTFGKNQDDDGKPAARRKVSGEQVPPDYAPPRLMDFAMPNTIRALENLATALPRESPIGQFFGGMHDNIKRMLELDHLRSMLVREAPGAIVANARQGELAKQRAKGELAGPAELLDADEMAVVLPGSAPQPVVVDEDDEELEGLANADPDDLREYEAKKAARSGRVISEEDDVDAADDEEPEVEQDDPKAGPANAVEMARLIRIRDVMQGAVIKSAFKPTLQLAFNTPHATLLRDALTAVGIAHAELEAAINKRLREQSK